jgi:hypothetical protein
MILTYSEIFIFYCAPFILALPYLILKLVEVII